MHNSYYFFPKNGMILLIVWLFLCSGLFARDYVRILKHPTQFKGIIVEDNFNVNIHRGKNFEAKVYGKEQEINKVILRIVDHKLEITKIHTPYFGIKIEETSRVEVTLPELESIVLNGSGNILTRDKFDCTNLSLNITGSGTITLNAIRCTSTKINISGSGSIILNGDTSKLDVTLDGSGSFNGEKLNSADADIEIAGSGEVRASVSKVLNATITGSGNIYYLGKPTVNRVITGSGDVTSLK